MHVRRSALVARPVEALFDLIEAAEETTRASRPGAAARASCRATTAWSSADLQVRWHGLHFEMRTRNPKRRPEHMQIHLEQGPFPHFAGLWQLKALNASVCRMKLELDDALTSTLVSHAAGGVFNQIADTLVDAFAQEALRRPEAPPGPGMPG